MTNVTKLSRVIKAIQGLLFISLGIVICVFYNNSSLHSAISYCVSTVILAYGLLTIAYSYLFQRGIASTDAISGVVLCSLSIFIYAVPDIVIKFLPLFFATFLIIYSVLFLIETIIAIADTSKIKGTKNIFKCIIYSFITIIVMALGIFILVVSIKEGSTLSNYLVLIIGIIIVLTGCLLTAYALIAPKKDILVTKNCIINGEYVDDKKLPQNIEKPAKTKRNSKNKKSSSPSIEEKKDEDNIKQIEAKDKTSE